MILINVPTEKSPKSVTTSKINKDHGEPLELDNTPGSKLCTSTVQIDDPAGPPSEVVTNNISPKTIAIIPVTAIKSRICAPAHRIKRLSKLYFITSLKLFRFCFFLHYHRIILYIKIRIFSNNSQAAIDMLM